MSRHMCLMLVVLVLCSGICCRSWSQTTLRSRTVINWVDVSPIYRSFSYFDAQNDMLTYASDKGIFCGSTRTGASAIFTTADGAAVGSEIQDFVADSLGLVWVDSALHYDDPRDELQVFDGLSWAGMGDGYSKIIASDESYGVWIEGYTENIFHLRLGESSPTVYYARDYGIDEWPYWCDIDSSGCLWGTPRRDHRVLGVSSFDGHDLRFHEAPAEFGDINCRAVDRLDRKWFVTSEDKRVGRFDGETWAIWGTEDGLPALRYNANFAFDQSWNPALLSEGSLIRFDGIRWQETVLPIIDGFTPQTVSSNEHGTLYITGRTDLGQGIYRVNVEALEYVGGIETPVYGSASYGGPHEAGIDREDGVWFSVKKPFERSSNIYHLGSAGYTAVANYPDESFVSVKVDQENRKWFGGSALVVIEDDQEVFYSPSPEYIRDIEVAPDGSVYVVYVGHLYHFADGQITAEELPWFDGMVWDVEVASDGTVWLAFGVLLWGEQYDGEGGIFFNSGSGWLEASPSNQWAWLSLEIDTTGRVWASNHDGFLWSFDGSGWTQLMWRDSPSHQYRLNARAHRPLVCDAQDRLWFLGSVRFGDEDDYQYGVFRFDVPRYEYSLWTQENGIIPNAYWSELSYYEREGAVSEDQYGNIWIASEGLSLMLAEESLVIRPSAAVVETSEVTSELTLSTAFQYMAPVSNADLYLALQTPTGQLFYVAPRTAEPFFPIFYAAFEGSTEFLKPGPGYHGPGSFPNTPDMKDLAASPVPLPDPPGGDGPTGLALFAYPVPYFANVPLPAYTTIADVALLSTTLPEGTPAGTYTFHIGITAPASISNVYRTASTTFEVSGE